MNIKTNIELVANYFLSRITMNNKKLQKIVYYAYCWFIVNNNDSANVRNVLFLEQPEAHGPVFPTLFEKYKKYGRNTIPKETFKLYIDKDLKKLFEEIIKVFGKYTGEQLELMTHNEVPWIEARNNYNTYEYSSKLISLQEIFNYYSNI